MPAQEKIDFEKHIEVCSNCADSLEIIKKAFNILDDQKKINVNPFLFTRIKERIAKKDAAHEKVLKRVLQPVFLFILVLFALGAGYFLGSGFNSGTKNASSSNYSYYVMQEPVEIALLSDN